MEMPAAIPAALLAPCGMNCLVCYKHCLSPRPCPGCRGEGAGKPGHCRRCAIRDCAARRERAFCASCPAFPCPPVQRLERSYRTHYGVSLAANGRAAARDRAAFLAAEAARWRCPACGGVISLHDRVCSGCGAPAPRGEGTR